MFVWFRQAVGCAPYRMNALVMPVRRGTSIVPIRRGVLVTPAEPE